MLGRGFTHSRSARRSRLARLPRPILGLVCCRSGAARKRLAVPFRAAHLPSERSEYAQPDTALSLTTLAYYHDGLSKQQLLDALGELLGLGPSAQEAHYSEWLELAGDGIPAGQPWVYNSRSAETG
jgi:hypothetical protein